ncbi:MAG: hypothetical protein NC489_41980 [Ruminococcus flavefaciens]|nr:hypothetical protein [Ruminococcus flavefaciens]
MRPYNVEIFTPALDLVGCTNVQEVTYKEDYLSADENSITVFPVAGVRKQDYIRISRGSTEYAGIITGIAYGTDRAKSQQTISFKPFVEMLSTSYLFDVDRQRQGSFEDFIAGAVTELFIENADEKQNVPGLKVRAVSSTYGWYLHITPADKGGHYNIVNLLDSVVVPALQKYSIRIKTRLDIQKREIVMEIGNAGKGVFVVEADLPNIIKKNIVIKQVDADVNKLILYDSRSGYEESITYYLHSDLGYDTKDSDRITPVVCAMRALSPEEGKSFAAAAQEAAADVFAGLSYSNLIELTVKGGDALVHPEEMEFGQVVRVISDGASYTSILTGKETGKTVKLIFGTVRLDLTKILRRDGSGR